MDRAVDFLRSSAKNLRFIKFVCVILAGALIAGTQFVGFDPATQHYLLVSVLFWVGVVLGVFGGVVLLVVDRNTPELLLALQEAESRAHEAQNNINVLEGKAALAREHAKAEEKSGVVLMAAREAVEAALLPRNDQSRDVVKQCERLLQLLDTFKETLFGMNQEQWTFSVYRFQESSGELHCVTTKRSFASEEPHRSWALGEGHVGKCFHDKREIICADATVGSMADMVRAPSEKYKASDDNLYISLALVPIGVDANHPMGVLVATSDQKRRFTNASEKLDGEWERENVLRNLAKHLALLFVIDEKK